MKLNSVLQETGITSSLNESVDFFCLVTPGVNLASCDIMKFEVEIGKAVQRGVSDLTL